MDCRQPQLRRNILLIADYLPVPSIEELLLTMTDSSSCHEAPHDPVPIGPALDESSPSNKGLQAYQEEGDPSADCSVWSEAELVTAGREGRKVREYQTYSFEFRRSVVESIRKLSKETGMEHGRVMHLEANKLTIPYRTIYRWFRDQTTSKRKATHPVMEARLAEFVRASGRRLKTKEIAAKAKDILEECGGSGEFNFSKGWYERFKRRMAGGEYDSSP